MRLLRLRLFFAMLAIAASAAQAKPLVKTGDRVVFLGDSITEQRQYTRDVMDFFTLRYPDARVSFRNAGWSGDTAPGGLNRLQRDVLSLKPDVVTICFGMNDGGYGPLNPDLYQRFIGGMEGLVTSLKKAGVKVVLLTPGAVDTDFMTDLAVKPIRDAYNANLAEEARGETALAAKENVPLTNIHTLMVDVQTRAKAEDPKFTMIPDSVHPSPPGHVVMAYGLLKALGCDEQPSGLSIDASAKKAKADRCRVTDAKFAPAEISFTRTDEALPAYFSPEAEVVFHYLSIVEELNNYAFRVTGLKGGNWRLSVEKMDVGVFTAETLARGVNLALKPGPWRTLGQKVYTLSTKQEDLYFNRWRNVSLATPKAGEEAAQKAELARLDKEIEAAEQARLVAAKDRTWRWTLTRE